MDISETAISACKSSASDKNVQFMLADFFSEAAGLPGGDFVFDYTFFCAIEPVERGAWAKRMSQIVRAKGHLLTLMYPLEKDPAAGGPPFGVTFSAYESVLRDHFSLVWRSGRDIPSVERRAKQEELALWERTE